jgi:polyhydroxyalkanoate synthase
MASDSTTEAPDVFTAMLRAQSEAARQLVAASMPNEAALAEWGEAAQRLQGMWLDFHQQQSLPEAPVPFLADPAQWMGLMQAWYKQVPMLDPERQQELWQEGVRLWQDILEQYGVGPDGEATAEAPKTEPDLPRHDPRFADPAWRKQPVFALIHQTYLLLAERLSEMVDEVGGLDSDERRQLRFALKSVLDAMSPANFPLTNPVVLERTLETHGANLICGIERLTADLEKGQLTHTDASAFKLGENIACTPGKVVHETPLYQLIQYSPAIEEVLEIPVVIFPPWINRFYILDLNPKKSFVKWAVEQGLTVFIVSWRSADASLAEVTWDDYIRAEIEAIDFVRERLAVPAVHALGYCVAGTTLAATLAILARRSQADKVRSATFLTAQVDFERAGDLKNFVTDTQLELIRQASRGGYLDGRYMAATFNMLRGRDLIWSYVVNNYLLGEEPAPFDLLHWNSDTTNLPAGWHRDYLETLYKGNKLAEKGGIAVAGTPIDIDRVETPTYVQAGREDHISPPQSVWKIMNHFKGAKRFVLAGSGHIAGVVNPPAAGKYQYWVNEEPSATLDAFVAGAEEHKGSWWPDWLAWLKGVDGATVKADGARVPGKGKLKAIEDAPGSYVKAR